MHLWRRAPEVLWRRTASGVVLRLPHDVQLVVLDGPAGALWDELDEPLTTAELCRRLQTTFRADTDTLVADVETALQELLGRGLAERCVG